MAQEIKAIKIYTIRNSFHTLLSYFLSCTSSFLTQHGSPSNGCGKQSDWWANSHMHKREEGGGCLNGKFTAPDYRVGVRCCHTATSHTFGSSCWRRSALWHTTPGYVEVSVSCFAYTCMLKLLHTGGYLKFSDEAAKQGSNFLFLSLRTKENCME